MMLTAKEREATFLSDLTALLAKHYAVLEVTDDGESYGMQCGMCEITMGSEWDDDDNQVSEFTCFRLPNYMDGTDG
uniref:Uncharacterized protein n=1 Tax=viral metagenome TaxID=1070528 RepID=A0A6M3L3B8_9ZZZZ